MYRHLRLMGTMIFVAILALLGAMGTVRPASAQTAGPVQVAEGLAAAQNANDPAAMRALIAPNALFVSDSGTEGREAWINDNTGAKAAHVTPSNIAQPAPDTVTADAVLSGGDIPPQLPHPFLVHVTFTVVNGQITRMVVVTDPQTTKDLEALFGPPPAGQGGGPSEPIDVVLALADAQNQKNPDAMRALLAPNARLVNDPMFGGVQNRDQFIADNSGAHSSVVVPSNVRQTSPNMVTADATLTGGDIPPQLPHPFTLHVTFTVVNGKVTQAVILLDEQTRKDLEALGPPPGMPSTGQPASGNLPVLLSLAALGLALAGLVLRTRRATR